MSDIPPNVAIKGIHHITLVSGHPERTARFYVNVLGLHFVKKTVNFDRPDTYHLYFGDEVGTPGTLVTFFGWPDAPPGRVGIGSTHHFALSVPSTEALLKWKTYLRHRHIAVAGPYRHDAYSNIIFVDPDGVQLELATQGPGWNALRDREEQLIPSRSKPFGNDELDLETWPEPVTEVSPDMRISGIHHISPVTEDISRTDAFYQSVLGMPLLHRATVGGSADAPQWYWRFEEHDGHPGGVITYMSLPSDVVPFRGIVGRGSTHHFAFEVESDEAQAFWRERLLERNLEVTPVLDRKYFRSIYFHDPDGHILEIATTSPGFLVDQPRDRLGKDLALPDWLEPERREIEERLPPIELEDRTPAR